MTRVVEEQERKGWGEMSVGRAPNTVWELDTAEWFLEELFRQGGTWTVSWGFLRVKTFLPGGTAFTKTQRQEEARCSGELVWVGVEHGYGYCRKKWSKVHRGPTVLVSGIYSLSPVRCGASESYLPRAWCHQLCMWFGGVLQSSCPCVENTSLSNAFKPWK